MNDNTSKIAAVEELIKSKNPSKRAVSQELEEILFELLPVLDKGFIRVIDYMGNDAAITQAARVSYGKGTKTVQNDKALINYLIRHGHTSPFEMCEIKFHIKAPIFVARQWVRHRTANINEYSARYSLVENEFYVPKKEQIMGQSSNNKQGRSATLAEPFNEEALNQIKNISKTAFLTYEKLLNLNNSNSDNKINNDSQKEGLARELARIVLPLNAYTEFYWKIDLHNLLHFLFLRVHPHAQYEIRVYAQTMLDILKKWVPLVFDAFTNYKQKSIHLSKEGHRVINDMLTQGSINKANYNLSTREWLELQEQFNIKIKNS